MAWIDTTRLARQVILGLADNRTIRSLMDRHGMRLGAARFVAGQNLADALDTVRTLNEEGLVATLDHLGESVVEPEAARKAASTYQELLRGIRDTGVDANVSLKLTQFGLAFDRDLALANLRRVVETARAVDNFVRIDMEDTPYTDSTLNFYRTLRAEGFDNLGVVIQAYLRRSAGDLEALAADGANVRLVKGAYNEPPDLAFPRKADVDASFRRLTAYYLEHGPYTAVATHDEALIDFTRRFVEEKGIPLDRLEFQMLYGIQGALQRRLAAEGYRVRVYVPFGRDWYPYFMRRLAERPANVGFILRNAVKR